MVITGIPREHVRVLWPKLEGSFKTFAKLSDGEESVGDLLHSVMQGKRQVWAAVVEDTHEFRAVALTEIRRNGVAWIVYVAGKGRHDWRDEMVETIEAWAREKGARRLAVAARRGWRGELRGFRERRIVMEKNLGQ